MTTTVWASLIPIPSETKAWARQSVLVREAGHLSLVHAAISWCGLTALREKNQKTLQEETLHFPTSSSPFGVSISEFFLQEWEKNRFW